MHYSSYSFQVLTACHHEPVATSALLSYILCSPLHKKVASRLDWLACMGTIGDLGTSFKWERPFPDMKECFKKHTKKTMNDAVSLLNARTSDSKNIFSILALKQPLYAHFRSTAYRGLRCDFSMERALLLLLSAGHPLLQVISRATPARCQTRGQPRSGALLPLGTSVFQRWQSGTFKNHQQSTSASCRRDEMGESCIYPLFSSSVCSLWANWRSS